VIVCIFRGVWLKVQFTKINMTYFEIVKLTDGGNTCESVFSLVDYPARFDPTSEAYYYTIRHRE